MRVTNDPDRDAVNDAVAEVMRLQGEFQARLADETLRYLRRLQATTAPSNPGTVARVAEGEALEATTAVGERVGFSLEVENRQEAYGSVAPALTPLVGEDGTSWFPAAEVQPTSTLLPPGEVVEVEIAVDVPEQLPAGRYRGALLLQGFRQDALPVVIEVRDDGSDRRATDEPDAGTDTTPEGGTDETRGSGSTTEPPRRAAGGPDGDRGTV